VGQKPLRFLADWVLLPLLIALLDLLVKHRKKSIKRKAKPQQTQKDSIVEKNLGGLKR